MNGIVDSRVQEVTEKKDGPFSKKEVQDIFQSCLKVHEEAALNRSTEELKQEIDRVLQAADSKRNSSFRTKIRWHKQIKFGNMSVYFHREQIPFKRKEVVETPAPPTAVKTREVNAF